MSDSSVLPKSHSNSNHASLSLAITFFHGVGLRLVRSMTEKTGISEFAPCSMSGNAHELDEILESPRLKNVVGPPFFSDC